MDGPGATLDGAWIAPCPLPVPPGPPLLRDQAAEQLLAERGWVVVPFLDADQVERLREGYHQLHPEGGRGFDTDFSYLDVEHKWAVEHLLRPVIEPNLDPVFDDVALFNATFVVKWPGSGSTLPLHQDWSYVDERSARSASLWIALDDIGPDHENGPLGFISGSHRLRCEPRGATSFGWYRPWSEEITAALRPVAVRAGEAIVFDNRILHASADNVSPRPRLAIASMVARADEPLRYVHRDPEAWVVHRADPAFFVDHSPVDLRLGSPADAEVVERLPVRPFEPPVAELEMLCGLAPGTLPTGPRPAEEPLSGSPLSIPRPSLGERLGLIRPVPLTTGVAPRLAGELAALGAVAWADRTSAVVPAGDLLDHWGPLDLLEVDHEEPTPSTDELVAALERIGARRLTFASIGSGFQMAPRREPRRDHVVLLVPIELPRPLGSVMFQAGDRLVALTPGRAVLIDPTWEHMAWNRGARSVVALLAEVPRRRAHRLVR